MKGVFYVAEKKNTFIKTKKSDIGIKKRNKRAKANNISDKQLGNDSQEQRFYKITYKREPYIDNLESIPDNIYEKTTIVSNLQLQRIKTIPWIKVLKIERLSKNESKKFKEHVYSFLLD